MFAPMGDDNPFILDRELGGASSKANDIIKGGCFPSANDGALPSGLGSLSGLTGLGAQFLPPWAGDAMAAGQMIQGLMNGGSLADMADGLLNRFLPPELKATYDALKKSGAMEDVMSSLFAPPIDASDPTPKSGNAPWAARLSDPVACPGGVGVIDKPCLPTVLIGGLAAARVTDIAVCNGLPTDSIKKGEDTVLIGGLPAARMSDPTAHGGEVKLGFPTVHIGKRVASLACDSCLKTDAAVISGSAISSPDIQPCF